MSHEIEWLATERVRATGAPPHDPWPAVLSAASRAHPAASFSFIERGPGEAFAWRLSGEDAAGDFVQVYVDPHRMEVTGSSGYLTFPFFMRQLHYQFLTSSSLMLYAVCALSFVLLGSLVSGLAVYKKFWRHPFRLRADRGGRVFWGDLHRLCALWSTWFVVAMAVTGAWYLVERGMDEAFGYSVERERPAQPPPGIPTGGTAIDIGKAVVIATDAMPGLTPLRAALPDASSGAYVIAGQSGAVLVRDRASEVGIDAATGMVLWTRRAEDMPPLERWSHTVDPLHFGDFGGRWSKLVWAVFGLALSLLPATGVVVWAKRSAAGPGRVAGGGALRLCWLLNAALLAIALFALPVFLAAHGS